MPIEHSQAHCRACQRNVLATRNGPNHVAHLLVSIVTAGIWIPFWIILSVFPPGWMCSQCGAKVSGSAGFSFGRVLIIVFLVVVVVIVGLAAVTVLVRPSGRS